MEVWGTKLVIGLVLLYCVHGSSAENSSETRVSKSGIPIQRTGVEQGRQHIRRMLLPLLLSIGSKLAQIVTMSLASMASTFVMAALAKKAFIISLIAFGMMIYDKYYKTQPTKVHYHVVQPHDDHHYAPSVSHEYIVDPSMEHSGEWMYPYSKNPHQYVGSASNVVRTVVQPPSSYGSGGNNSSRWIPSMLRASANNSSKWIPYRISPGVSKVNDNSRVYVVAMP